MFETMCGIGILLIGIGFVINAIVGAYKSKSERKINRIFGAIMNNAYVTVKPFIEKVLKEYMDEN